MCGRINLRMSPAELAEVFGLFREPDWQPRYNLGPMQQALVIRLLPDGSRIAEPMQWGLVPSWADDPKIGSQLFNARSETVATKPSFRSAFRKRRCLIPADGFYEWQKLNAKSKQAWHIYRADGSPMALAGLWEHWTGPDGNHLDSCSVITTTANQFMSPVHDRMPVILDPSLWSLWLTGEETDPAALTELLVPCPDEWLERSAVSSLVNNVRNESPDCIRPIDVPRSLF